MVPGGDPVLRSHEPGPHLHFEARDGSVRIDPPPLLS